ncbi:MAG: hypothetical protein PUF65_06005 [Lachnospiraceae bacterium]|nr:hypothetical protein [Lachnospiraceae bacterium]
MTVFELRRELERRGIKAFEYNLDGKGRTDERICLAEKDGKWEVYYAERGVKTTDEYFDTQEEACQFIYDMLTN